MKVTVIGAGYVGLVAAAGFAHSGNAVWCVDAKASVVEQLETGIVPIYEPGLQELAAINRDKGRLHFTTDLEQAVRQTDIVFIAVGTPPGEDGSADLSHVLNASNQIGRSMNGHKTIVIKSTVPVGTADSVRETISAVTDHPFDVVSNPEFLKEGSAVSDFLHPDRIVIGTDNQSAAERIRDLYLPFVRKRERFVIMDNRSAELTKYAANAMLATRVSFMNDLAVLADGVGADIEMIRRGIGSDSRIGLSFLYPGIGYGGSCFPKDVKAILKTAREQQHTLRIIEAVSAVNRDQRVYVFNKLKSALDDDLSGKQIAVWGLAFKPRTDDMRMAPSLDVIRGCLAAGARVHAYDPVAMDNARSCLDGHPDLRFGSGPYAVLPDADALVICTEWMEFREPDFQQMSGLMKRKLIVDGRNLYDPARMRSLGYDYRCVGRPH